MLRLEQGFEESLFESDDSNLRGYTNHHRLVVPALIAADIYNAGHSGVATRHKLDMVLDGSARALTLAFEADNVRHGAQNLGWVAIKEEITFDDMKCSPWRVVRRDDPHQVYSGVNAWSATRNLLKLPYDAPDDQSTRVRERYTFAASNGIDEEDIRGILEQNDAPDEVMIGTATVYAINKLVSKPTLTRERVDMSRFPTVYESMQQK